MLTDRAAPVLAPSDYVLQIVSFGRTWREVSIFGDFDVVVDLFEMQRSVWGKSLEEQHIIHHGKCHGGNFMQAVNRITDMMVTKVHTRETSDGTGTVYGTVRYC